MRANKSPPIPHVSGATIPCTIFTAIAASTATATATATREVN